MNQPTKSDIAPPEPIVFLELALYAMQEYHEQEQRFPAQWHDLDISFSGGPYYTYRAGDQGTFPTKEDGTSWKPRDCDYRYVIESATATSFRIVALTPDNEVAYELTETMDSPRSLIPPGESTETLHHPHK